MRPRALPASLVLLLVMALPSFAQDASARLPSVELPPELDRVLREYERHWESSDAAALAMLFADDGFVSGGDRWIRGRAGIQEQYARAGGPLRLRALAYAMDGNAGYIIGAYGYAPMDAQADAGKFVLALRRAADGRWLIAADLDSSNQRPGS